MKVLGTSFNVKTIGEQTEVIVNSGKVAFYGHGKPDRQITLQAGEKGTYNAFDNRGIKTQNQDPNYLSWKTGRLIFENTSLAESLTVLERHYAVKITLWNPEMASCLINTRFENQTLSEVLEEISLLLGGTFEPNSDGFTLKGNGCH